MRIALASLLTSFAFVACAHVLTPVKTPVLAPVDAGQLEVRFIGTSPDKSELFVCGWFAGDGGRTLDCVDYEYFMLQLQAQP